jgi:hypothetical protein
VNSEHSQFPTTNEVAGIPVAGIPVAGTPVAGIPVAGIPVAGTPVAGNSPVLPAAAHSVPGAWRW